MTITTILAALNSYDGDNLWEDVVHLIPTYDHDRTCDEDTDARSDFLYLTDGTRIDWDGKKWAVSL